MWLSTHCSSYIDKDFLKKRRVLIFPPVISRYRFLIHKLVEDIPELSSFSIGQEERRRTVVCASSSRKGLPEEGLSTEKRLKQSDHPQNQESQCPSWKEEIAPCHRTEDRRTKRKGDKRPDRQLYVPRGRRTQQKNPPSPSVVSQDIIEKELTVPGQDATGRTLESIPNTSRTEGRHVRTEIDKHSTPKSKHSSRSGIKGNKSGQFDFVELPEDSPEVGINLAPEFPILETQGKSDSTETGISSLNFRTTGMLTQSLDEMNTPKTKSTDSSTSTGNKSASVVGSCRSIEYPSRQGTAGLEASVKLNDSKNSSGDTTEEMADKNKAPAEQQGGNSDKMGKDTKENQEQARDGEEEEEDDWDKMFDDSGDALLTDEVEDLTKELNNTRVSVKKPKNDYDNYNPKDHFDYTAIEHIIELSDFPSEFKTQDLITTFSAFKSKGVDIKWVDDTHALAVFPTAAVAQDALGLSNPMLRTRHISLASKQSKLKARECAESLLPYKPRPETSAAVARNMVTGALGMKTKVTREQRDQERQRIKDVRKEVKEKKRVEKKQIEDIWDGKI